MHAPKHTMVVFFFSKPNNSNETKKHRLLIHQTSMQLLYQKNVKSSQCLFMGLQV